MILRASFEPRHGRSPTADQSIESQPAGDRQFDEPTRRAIRDATEHPATPPILNQAVMRYANASGGQTESSLVPSRCAPVAASSAYRRTSAKVVERALDDPTEGAHHTEVIDGQTR